jgi:hypothetical protein
MRAYPDRDIKGRGMMQVNPSLSPIFRVYGNWAVTVSGIECITGESCIKAEQLHEDDFSELVEKDEDFELALAFACELFDEKGSIKNPLKYKCVATREYNEILTRTRLAINN